MALLLSLWFLLGYLRWSNFGMGSWLLVGAFLGAGLVKVTTFMLYLVLAAVGTLMLLWRNRPTPEHPAGRVSSGLPDGA